MQKLNIIPRLFNYEVCWNSAKTVTSLSEFSKNEEKEQFLYWSSPCLVLESAFPYPIISIAHDQKSSPTLSACLFYCVAWQTLPAIPNDSHQLNSSFAQHKLRFDFDNKIYSCIGQWICTIWKADHHLILTFSEFYEFDSDGISVLTAAI